MAVGGPEVEPIHGSQSCDLRERLGAERQPPFEGVKHNAFEQIAQGEVEVLGQSLENFEGALFDSHASLNTLDVVSHERELRYQGNGVKTVVTARAPVPTRATTCLRIITDRASHTAIAGRQPADPEATASIARLSATDTSRLSETQASVAAAWKVLPMVTMLDDPLPEGVIARIIRPADTMEPPMIVLSRTSARMRVFTDARAVLTGDIVRNPIHTGERTVDYTWTGNSSTPTEPLTGSSYSRADPVIALRGKQRKQRKHAGWPRCSRSSTLRHECWCMAKPHAFYAGPNRSAASEHPMIRD